MKKKSVSEIENETIFIMDEKQKMEFIIKKIIKIENNLNRLFTVFIGLGCFLMGTGMLSIKNFIQLLN